MGLDLLLCLAKVESDKYVPAVRAVGDVALGDVVNGGLFFLLGLEFSIDLAGCRDGGCGDGANIVTITTTTTTTTTTTVTITTTTTTITTTTSTTTTTTITTITTTVTIASTGIDTSDMPFTFSVTITVYGKPLGNFGGAFSAGLRVDDVCC